MNSKQSHITRSTKVLKQQVLQDLGKVNNDLREIQQRITPGQIIDDALSYRRGSGDPARTLQLLKDNPIGTSFLTLGTLLLMESERHQSYEEYARIHYGMMKERLGENIDDLRDKVSGMGEKLAEMKDKLTSRPEKIAGEPPAFDREGQYDESREASKHLDPLTYLALGAGLGALTGASLPVSASEREAVDSVFGDRIRRFTGELQTALNEAVNILKNEFLGDITEVKMNFF